LGEIPRIKSVATGNYNSCAADQLGDVYCWGRTILNSLGFVDRSSGPPIISSNEEMDIFKATGLPPIERVSAASRNFCALTRTGSVICVGIWAFGVSPAGATGPNNMGFIPVTGIDSAEQISTGNRHSCSLLTDGTIRCWGYNYSGQLGNQGVVRVGDDTNLSVEVTSLPDATQIGCGGDHCCAVVEDGDVYCWGANSFGQLGNGHVLSSDTGLIVDGI
jgi:alpha-tubulin suppressor-like RCC1 family protein